MGLQPRLVWRLGVRTLAVNPFVLRDDRDRALVGRAL